MGVPSGHKTDDEQKLSIEIELMSLNIEQQILASPIPIRPNYTAEVQRPTSTPHESIISKIRTRREGGMSGRNRTTIVPPRDIPISPDTPNRQPIFRPYQGQSRHFDEQDTDKRPVSGLIHRPPRKCRHQSPRRSNTAEVRPLPYLWTTL